MTPQLREPGTERVRAPIEQLTGLGLELRERISRGGGRTT